MSEVVVQKIPSLTCKKCGSFRIMMTDDGPECSDCDVASTDEVDLSTEIEYLIYQLNCKESK